MVFGNQTDKASESQTKQKQITMEELKALKEKVSKVDELKKEKAELQEKIEELKDKNEDYLNRLQRLQADYENYKKRIDRASEEYKTYATENILKKLVTHYDDLKRTQEVIDNIKDGDESVEKGIQMITKNFEKLLNEEDVEAIESEGEKFDPYKHEVMLVKDDKSVPKNTVLEELEKGYMFKNKVLRPAKVMISK